MSARVMPFLFEGDVLVRVVEQDGVPWFVAEDVCRALGITKHRDAVARLDGDETRPVEVDTNAGPRLVAAMGEGGLFTLILRSRQAMEPGTLQHRFRKWVTGEVLPAIRRAGAYLPAASEPEVTRIRMVTEARQVFGLRAAAELWFRLALPVVPAMQHTVNQGELLFPLGEAAPD